VQGQMERRALHEVRAERDERPGRQSWRWNVVELGSQSGGEGTRERARRSLDLLMDCEGDRFPPISSLSCEQSTAQGSGARARLSLLSLLILAKAVPDTPRACLS
jgi:hypothetical protein